ncbi:zinc finger and SCAN domain-containing protein 20-like [Malaclemys terrapin pileata]|uniref:zinc finger and SCAN domain-containing protein 20-like n=1 Tax=Malaclemys terrapin pileata TaxID=2991368 RepID=UPI0023A7F11A|nr:zinc finger and SCAN domain-containing protein 20-like [Malaclemys terrapin pileata]
MPPRAKRAPAWSNGELLDLITVWGEEAVPSQLRSSRRNYDTFGKVSKDMMERGHDRDALQCRIKVKTLRSAYRKAHDTNGRSGAPPTTYRFYKELDAILGVNPTSTPSTTMDTSYPVWGGEEEVEEEENGRVVGRMETPWNPWSHAARSSSRARRKVASHSGQYLVEDKQKSRFLLHQP